MRCPLKCTVFVACFFSIWFVQDISIIYGENPPKNKMEGVESFPVSSKEDHGNIEQELLNKPIGSTFVDTFKEIASFSPSVLAGGISGGLLGGIVTFFVWWRDKKLNLGTELLQTALEIHASQEAWILEGKDYKSTLLSELSEKQHLKPIESDALARFWLRPVEVRTVLDQEAWNTAPNQFYGFVNGRRAWIVRDKVTGRNSYGRVLPSTTNVEPHPALLSSRAVHELCVFIERAANLWNPVLKIPKILTKRNMQVLKPYLLPVAHMDRREFFGNRLTPHAIKFLIWYEKKYDRNLQMGILGDSEGDTKKSGSGAV